ncbi:MAG TPA: lysylphosphatidylglycerol synthase transmembrane domain-containing protein [Chitinophagaceae bacterium]|nr:lysylphosphatidylglycerol synthase transmembrane domain-containing protein [Chitinophagaceae bacterium]
MDDPAKTESKTSKLFKLLLKIAVTAICLWYVSGKINFQKAGLALQNANWLYLLPALIAFIFSKLLSAIRLNIYFRNINIHLPGWQNVKLYWLGMFYNLFLPGSISGDAYKVILLTKKYNTTYKKTTAAVLLDRFSGLLGLGLILSVYSIVVLNSTIYISAIICGAILAVIVLYLVIKTWLKDFISSFFSTLLLGIAVQASQVVCAYLVMASLNIPFNQTEYIFLFLISSVVAVLPLTIGGLGAREVVFLEGSKYFGLIRENSVVISILFYLITLFTSAWGLFYVFKNPLKEKRPSAFSR